MKYIVETGKSVQKASEDLQEAVTKMKYGVLHIHNLKETMRKKGVEFPNECQIFEICNPQKANEVLKEDMEMNLVLPCRVSVYSEKGKTRIGMIKPTALLGILSSSSRLAEVAKEVEADLIRIIDSSK
ncbi:PF03625 domain protein [Leptospira broomii serovar Hurstbridge str. 5399]|uniref:PF03625 domain protein n=1 Tax=Leptospira broomii serovar Hurstbridge str. 5399 TaxID=1049789 RepID=T0FHN1_9LEPT|nr:DUF302 domain-containing protein [Leptospira broomii]EQA47077.1 PF03625 domain protein [Leptospira broomii serovar Hurstbridge str. 5399]